MSSGKCHSHWSKALPSLRRKISSCGASSAQLTWLLGRRQGAGNLLCCYYTAQTVHRVCRQLWVSLWDYAKGIKRGTISGPDLKTSWLRFHYHEICLNALHFLQVAVVVKGSPCLLPSESWLAKSFICKPEHWKPSEEINESWISHISTQCQKLGFNAKYKEL